MAQYKMNLSKTRETCFIHVKNCTPMIEATASGPCIGIQRTVAALDSANMAFRDSEVEEGDKTRPGFKIPS